MARYDKMALTSDQYTLGKNVQEKNGNAYSEQYFGSRKSLYRSGLIIGSTMVESKLNIGEITNQEFRSFLAGFNKKLYKRLMNEKLLFELKIVRSGAVARKDFTAWKKLPIGSYFYNIDLSSAYWQIGYRLGYIDQKLFDKYIQDDRYKQAKRLCFSFLGRENKMIYHTPGGSNSYEIKCDMTALTTVYDNVRNELNRIIISASEASGEFIEYNTDGIAVYHTEVAAVKSYFKSQGLIFKITKHKKISDTHYSSGSISRRFKR